LLQWLGAASGIVAQFGAWQFGAAATACLPIGVEPIHERRSIRFRLLICTHDAPPVGRAAFVQMSERRQEKKMPALDLNHTVLFHVQGCVDARRAVVHAHAVVVVVVVVVRRVVESVVGVGAGAGSGGTRIRARAVVLAVLHRGADAGRLLAENEKPSKRNERGGQRAHVVRSWRPAKVVPTRARAWLGALAHARAACWWG